MKKSDKSIYVNDIPGLYGKEIEAVSDMLQYNSEESLERIYNLANERINSGKFEVSEKIVLEAVKKLLKRN